jgi:hypothetical protein
MRVQALDEAMHRDDIAGSEQEVIMV